MSQKLVHKSVLYDEVLSYLAPGKDKVYIDTTFGGGGHSRGILTAGGKVFGLDFDKTVLEQAVEDFSLTLKKDKEFLYAQSDRLILCKGNFAKLEELAKEFGIEAVEGILFDLGFSSLQMDDPSRGLSFSRMGPLDMRLDEDLQISARDLINSLSEGQLYDLFTKYGEEHNSRRIARAIVQRRVEKEIESTRDLAEIIENLIGRREKIHPATRVFQALRIVVNSELNNLEKGLEASVPLLKKGGRLIVISFHSLEDRIVKNFLKNRRDLAVLTKKPITPKEIEVLDNPRSRSAKMRAAQKI